MWHRVGLVETDVLEECVASIFGRKNLWMRSSIAASQQLCCSLLVDTFYPEYGGDTCEMLVFTRPAWCHMKTSNPTTQFLSERQKAYAYVINWYNVRFEVFTVVIMKNAVFWDVVLYGSCKNRCFGGTYHLHHKGNKNCLACRFLSSWWWKRYIPPKRRFLQEPHCVTSQKTTFFKPIQIHLIIAHTYYSIYLIIISGKQTTNKNSMAFSPQANYADWAASDCRWSFCQLLWVEGCLMFSTVGSHCHWFRFSRSGPLLSHSNSSSVIVTRLSGSRSRPTTSQKIW
jgi:hypothetical protein